MDWDPSLYARFGDERARPFVDLVSRIGSEAPRRVVDLGCGTGALTSWLAQRWPAATIQGVDSSPEMVRAAVDGVEVTRGVMEDWQYPADADVVLSNAALQWVPTHVELLERWAALVPEGGWLAWQVPANFGAPSHVLMRELADEFGVGHALRHSDAVLGAQEYAELLLHAGLETDAWETTYVHVLRGQDPVLDWVRGTGLRPVIAALSPGELEAFEREYSAALRTAYPATGDRTLFPFRRVFAVGHRA